MLFMQLFRSCKKEKHVSTVGFNSAANHQPGFTADV